jgi:hypothetical protein
MRKVLQMAGSPCDRGGPCSSPSSTRWTTDRCSGGSSPTEQPRDRSPHTSNGGGIGGCGSFVPTRVSAATQGLLRVANQAVSRPRSVPRRISTKHEVALADIEGSGTGRRMDRADIERALASARRRRTTLLALLSREATDGVEPGASRAEFPLSHRETPPALESPPASTGSFPPLENLNYPRPLTTSSRS